MQFLISLHINPAVLDALTDEEKEAIGEGHGRFIQTLKKSGELISTQALVDPSQAAVVSVRNGQPVVTDGPFLQAKEHLGGFYLIDCEDKDRAIELAAQIPDAAIDGLGVEVRQVMFAALGSWGCQGRPQEAQYSRAGPARSLRCTGVSVRLMPPEHRLCTSASPSP